ncbi:MAG: hypothetical protein RRC07_11005 [Anaerolineae bacterium]|nr:hypothetical protein [Anaerolineae bacterium]
MARKRDLASKLTQETSRPGWRDTITGSAETAAAESEARPEPKAPETRRRRNRLQRKTYLLTPDLVDHIAELAEQERVGINELVRWLLREALAQIESGDLVIPTRPANRQIVQQ